MWQSYLAAREQCEFGAPFQCSASQWAYVNSLDPIHAGGGKPGPFSGHSVAPWKPAPNPTPGPYNPAPNPTPSPFSGHSVGPHIVPGPHIKPGPPPAPPYEFQGRYTSDWFSSNIPTWWQLYGALNPGRPMQALEVGSYEGRSAEWMLDTLLTHPDCRLTCVDTFAGSFEHSVASGALERTFDANTARFGPKVVKVVGSSFEVLRGMPRRPTFDLVYIDGEHHAASVLEDAVLAFGLVKPGGVLIFDDIGGHTTAAGLSHPYPGLQAFLAVFADRVRVLHSGYQVHVQKLSQDCTDVACPCRHSGAGGGVHSVGDLAS